MSGRESGALGLPGPIRKAFFWPCIVGTLIAVGCAPAHATPGGAAAGPVPLGRPRSSLIPFCQRRVPRAFGLAPARPPAARSALSQPRAPAHAACPRDSAVPMLCFGVVCLAFDVDDDPEHLACGPGETVTAGPLEALQALLQQRSSSEAWLRHGLRPQEGYAARLSG